MNGWRLKPPEGLSCTSSGSQDSTASRPEEEIVRLAKTLYIGNLPWSATEEDLSALVSPHATVLSARIATDRDTGRSRGFGFVEVEDEQLQAAVDALQNMEMDGRVLTVNEARPREPRGDSRGPRPSGGGGGGRRW